jgi:hypothetical protein
MFPEGKLLIHLEDNTGTSSHYNPVKSDQGRLFFRGAISLELSSFFNPRNQCPDVIHVKKFFKMVQMIGAVKYLALFF